MWFSNSILVLVLILSHILLAQREPVLGTRFGLVSSQYVTIRVFEPREGPY